MAVKELSDGGTDGARLGQSTSDLVGFWGKTPIDQPAATDQSAVATATLTTITDIVTTASVTGAFNAVVARATALTTLVNQLRSDLVDAGIIKGSA